ncbi:MAG: mechanosensitive ion channel family protein [Theionarchaea archaeon]|nr:mechanosensitive ion channel family protein [Theionarchaea archaeon]MBU7000061.1 mechanosensitive ion channel family protein [Theionarchaea archaeon]MBU7021641.1 mechanosensitive ion channel family protein [Theionarchaea archaeon]MBU7039372.1 mechanosensitive ion channel family protein [Theionarchaea archaeon]
MIDQSFSLYGDVTLRDIVVFLATVAVSVVVARIVRTNIRRALKDKVAEYMLSLLEKLVYYGIISVGIVIGLPLLGLHLTGLLVAGGVAGVVLGFASQSVVSNLISGLFLIIERPVKIGDQVCVGDISGVVKDIRVLSTVVRTYDGMYVRIPNEKVFSSNITNYVAYPARRFEYSIGIGYEDDAEEAIRVIRKVLEDHPFVLVNPRPTVFVDDLGDSSVRLNVRVWAPSQVWYTVQMELLWKMKVGLEKAGITIPFPQRVIHIAGRVGE